MIILALCVELAGLVAVSGFVASTLFPPAISDSLSAEGVLLVAGH